MRRAPPAFALGGDLAEPAGAGGPGAVELVGLGATGQHGDAGGFDPEPPGLHHGPCRGRVGEGRRGGLRLGECAAAGGELVGAAGHGRAQRRRAAVEGLEPGLGARLRPGGFGSGLLGGLAGGAGGGLAGRGVAERGGSGGAGAAGGGELGRGGGDGGAELGEAVALLQPQRGGRGRGAGRDREAVPAPEVALAADQPLARDEPGLEPSAVGAIDQPERGEAPGQCRRRGDMGRQRRGAVRQRRGRVERRQRLPAGQRQRQLVGQRGAQRGFEARRHADGVEDRGGAAGGASEQTFQPGRLGLERPGGAFGLGEAAARGGFGAAGSGGGGLGGFEIGLGGSGGGRRRRGGAAGFAAGRLGRCQLAGGGGECRLGGLKPARALGGAAAGVLEQPLSGLMLGGQPRRGLGAGVELGLDGGERGPGLGGCGAGRGERAGVPGALGVERGGLRGEPGRHRHRVAVERGLALAVGGELGELGLERRDLPGRGLGLGVEPVALDAQPLQQGGGDRVLLAQRRQRLLGRGAQPGGGRGLGLGGAGGAGGRDQRRGGSGASLVGVAPVPPDQLCLGAAQRLGELAVALRLAGLAGEGGELGLQRLEHVADPAEVDLGGVELELGLVAALVEAGDAGGLFQHPAAGLGAGVDQLGDLALADQRRRLGSGRGVGEQHGDVAGAGLAAAHAIGRAGVAGDAADDLQLVVLVEAGGRPAGAVVERQRDLGVVPGRAAAGAVEDHVLHAVAAHHAGAVLAHHPAQGLEQVRLAAAVRAHHAGQARGDDELGGVDEALEPREAQAAEMHGRCPALFLAGRFREGRGSVNRECPAYGGAGAELR